MELLLAVVIIGIIAVVAYPSLDTFTGRTDDASAATRVSRMVNRVKDQARRRNRAYLLRFDEMAENNPQGLMIVWESRQTSCSLATVEQARELRRVPFGQTEWRDFRGDKPENVGIAGWVPAGADEPQAAQLTLCVSPSGAMATGVGPLAEPLSGRIALQVQRFDKSNGSWRPMGPAREVELTYAGNARLRLN
jgi:type II secretory pathway pseudopilin PulG